MPCSSLSAGATPVLLGWPPATARVAPAEREARSLDEYQQSYLRTRLAGECLSTARGRREPVGDFFTWSELIRKTPVLKRTCANAQDRARRFFSWTVHCAAVGGCAAYGCGIPPAVAARSLFGKTKREWGVECPAIIMAPAPSHRTAPPHASGKPAHRD